MYSQYIGDIAVLMNCQSRGDAAVVTVYLVSHHSKDLGVTRNTCHSAHPYRQPVGMGAPLAQQSPFLISARASLSRIVNSCTPSTKPVGTKVLKDPWILEISTLGSVQVTDQSGAARDQSAKSINC